MSVLHNIWDFIRSWWVVAVFIIIFANGIHVTEDFKIENTFEFYNRVGVLATVSISFLALIAYIQFAHSKFKTTQYQKWISSLNIHEKKAALLIGFGGKGGSPETEMKGFARHTLNIDSEQMMFKDFGTNRKVKREDILELKNYISKFQNAFSHAEEIIVLIKGAGPAFAVCGDMLGNWKPMKIYHYQGKYELWYASEKHAPKDIDNINKTQIRNDM